MSQEIVAKAQEQEVQQADISLGALQASSPKALVEGASAIANELAGVVKKQGLSVNIQGRAYVKVEGWTTLSTLMGVMPREVETTEQDGVYVAVIELVKMNDGQVLSRASAECGADKPWNTRAKYARRSMAQTRATAKACRLAFSWIMSLAGYATTPYEEVQDITPQNGNAQSRTEAAQEPQGQHSGQGSGQKNGSSTAGQNEPSQPQLKKLGAVLGQLGISDQTARKDTINNWLENQGYSTVSSSKEIPKDVMKELIDDLESEAKEQEANNA